MSVRQPYPVSGGGVEIGGTVSGGTSGSVLFVDSSGNLAEDNPEFTYSSGTLTINPSTTTTKALVLKGAASHTGSLLDIIQSDSTRVFRTVNTTGISGTELELAVTNGRKLWFILDDTAPTSVTGWIRAVNSREIEIASNAFVRLNVGGSTLDMKAAGNWTVPSGFGFAVAGGARCDFNTNANGDMFVHARNTLQLDSLGANQTARTTFTFTNTIGDTPTHVVTAAGIAINSSTNPTLALEVFGKASTKTAFFRAHATSPGNITEWQNSSGTALSWIDSTGIINAKPSGNYRSMLCTKGTGANEAAITFFDGTSSYATLGLNGTSFSFSTSEFVNTSVAAIFKSGKAYFSDDTNLYGVGEINGEVASGSATPAIQAVVRDDADTGTEVFVVSQWNNTRQIKLLGNGGAIFNEEGNDADFRIEGDNDPNLFRIDASDDAILLGQDASSKLAFYGVTAVVQPTTIADADGTLADLTTKFNSLLSKLETLGLLASA